MVSEASLKVTGLSRSPFQSDKVVRTETGERVWVSKYPSFRISQHLLNEAQIALGVSYFRLGRMLGLPNPSDIYRWRSGYRRPSPLYLFRLVHLLLLLGKRELDIISFNGATYWDEFSMSFQPKFRRIDIE